MTSRKPDVPDRVDNLSGLMAVQDNVLIQSAYTMTLLEKRLLMLAISKIDATSAPKARQCLQVTVTRDEWAELYRDKDPWTDLNRAADRLMGRVVIIHPTESRGVRRKLNWTDSCEYRDSEVLLRFGYSLSVYLAGMLDQFTQSDLLDVAKLSSFYAVRLYELFKQRSEGHLFITVDEFRTVMDCTKKYERFASFNQAVIKPAVAALREAMPELDVQVEYVKKRRERAISSLKFHYKLSDQRDLFSDSKPLDPTPKTLSKRDRRQAVTDAVMDVHNTDW